MNKDTAKQLLKLKNTKVGKNNTGLEQVGGTGEKNEKAKNLKNTVSVKKANRRKDVGMGWVSCHWASYTGVGCKRLVCPNTTHVRRNPGNS